MEIISIKCLSLSIIVKFNNIFTIMNDKKNLRTKTSKFKVKLFDLTEYG